MEHGQSMRCIRISNEAVCHEIKVNLTSYALDLASFRPKQAILSLVLGFENLGEQVITFK